MPPPVCCGMRSEPWRARPVPFCLCGLRPDPDTSPRRSVECDPWRAAARWATTTWWMSGTLVCTSKSSAGRSTVPTFLPLASTTSIVVALAMALRSLRCGADEDDAALGAGNGTLHEQQVLLGVDSVHGEVLHRDAVAAHTAGHALAA